jgi:hypothetical protein
MKILVRLFFGFILSGIVAWSALAQEGRKFTFKDESPGKEANLFSSMVGMWLIDKDGPRYVYAVDGRSGKSFLSQKAEINAKALFGAKHADFLKGITAYKEFPLTICKEVPDFSDGTLVISFKAISGGEDQAAGIAFNIKPNGEYLAVRANALEKNLVLFKFEKGRRTSLQWVNNVPTSSRQWHTLKVTIKGKKIEGYLDDKQYLNYTSEYLISGRIGLWSKADSYVLFDNFIVQPM